MSFNEKFARVWNEAVLAYLKVILSIQLETIESTQIASIMIAAGP
jgi:hypothetical protein